MNKRMSGTIGFDPHITQLVGDANRNCMLSIERGGFDLHRWDEVASRAETILKHLKGEDGFLLMPPQGWPQSKIDIFQHWINDGTPKRSGDLYAAFFREIDAHTEYYDVYGIPDGLEDLRPAYSQFFGTEQLLNTQWLAYFRAKETTSILSATKENLWESVLSVVRRESITNALLHIDEFICNLALKHFSDNQIFDKHACLEAFRYFGEDVLPEDGERELRIKELGNSDDFRLASGRARFHRMDTRALWFFWFGHIQCVQAIVGDNDPLNDVRKTLAAGLFVGQVFDTAYRDGSNRQTRHTYLVDKDAVWQTGFALSDNFEYLEQEMQELFHQWSAPAT